MTRLLLSLPLVAALATSAAAQSQGEIDSFLTAAAAVGCVITADTAPQIEQQTGFSQAKLGEIIQSLIASNGLTVPDAETVRVVAGPCAG